MDNNLKSDRELFEAAAEMSETARRRAYLDRECAGNAAQRERVLGLLAALEDAGDFLETNKPDISASDIGNISEGPGSIIGNYKLLQEIGEGGFGVVYMAEQLRPVKRKVALKIIKPGMDTREVIARFEAERQALALMTHPNIAQVFDGGTTDSGRPYFVMELVKGIPITEFCDQSKLSTDRRLDLFLDICNAIQHAHQKGVIHRDIKPTNVLVTLHDGIPVPKVIDFGIAKAINQELTEKSLFTAYGQMIGTPLYTSPEQAEMSGLDIDTRTDIYSLGVLLYELLTGETPISREELKRVGVQGMQKLIRENEATKPSLAISVSCRTSTAVAASRQREPEQLISEVRGDLDWIVLKALEKDRTRRYETASAFAEDIRRHLDHRPVVACPPTALYLLEKFAWRHRRLIVAVAGTGAVLLLAAIGMTVLYFRADADRAVARQQTTIATSAKEDAEKAQAAEAEQRKLTQQSARKLQTTLSRADFVAGVAHLERGQPNKGLSYLARSLRTDSEFHPAAQSIVATLRDQNFDLQPELKLEHNAAVRDFTLSEDGRHILTTAHDQTVRLWDAESLELKKEWGMEDPVISSDFVGEGNHVVVATAGGLIRVWNVATMQASGPAIQIAGPVRRVVASLRSPDHPIVAVLAGDHSLRVWDGRNGKAMTPTLEAKDLKATDCHLNIDGTGLLARFGDRLFRYYDVATGRRITDDIQAGVAFARLISMERETLVVIDRDRSSFMAYHFGTGAKQFAHIAGEQKLDLVFPPVVSADQSLIICVSRPTAKLKGVGRGIVRGSNVVTRVFDPTNAVLIAASSDARSNHDPVIHAASGISALQVDDFYLRIRDLKTTRILAETKLTRAIAARSPTSPNIVFSPSGDRFAIRYADHGFAVYQTLTGRWLAEGGSGRVPFRTVQFSPEGQRLAITTDDGVLQIWNAISGAPITARLQHRVSIGKVVFSRNGNRVFSMDRNKPGAETPDGVVRSWDARESAARYPAMRLPLLASPPAVFSDGQRTVVGTRNGEILVLGSGSGFPPLTLTVADKKLRPTDFSSSGGKLAAVHLHEVFLWNLNGSELPLHLSLKSPVVHAKLSANGEHLVTLTSKRQVQVWNADDGTPITLPLPPVGPVLAMDVHSAVQKLFIANRDRVQIWDLKSENPEKSITRINVGVDRNAGGEFSPDGTLLLTVKLGEVQIWNVATGERLDSFPHPFLLRSAHFSPDGRQIVVAGPDFGDSVPGVVLIWNRDNHRQVAELVHEHPVMEAIFDRQAKHIITKDVRGTLRLWHVRSGQPLGPPMRHQSSGAELAFAIGASGNELLSLSDGKLRTWPMPVDESKVPVWLGALAEAVAGQRLDGEGQLEMVPTTELAEMLKRLSNLTGKDGFSRFGRWYSANRSTRTLAPNSDRKEDDLVEQLLAENKADGLREVLRLRPENALAFARLASKVTPEKPFLTKPWQSFPEWYGRQAIQLDPSLAEGWLSQADMLERRGKYAACLNALTEFERLSGPTMESVYLRALAIWEGGEGEVAYELFRPHLEKLQGIKAEDLPTDPALRYLAARLRGSDSKSGKQLSGLAVQMAQVSGKRRISRALADWISRRAAELAPADPVVLAGRAKVSKLLDQESDAVNLISELIRKDPKNHNAWYSMAIVQSHDQKYEAALKSINASLELQPEVRGKTRRKLKLQVLEALGMETETRKLYLEMEIRERFFPPSKEMVDLTPYYNKLLTETWPGMNFGGHHLTFSHFDKPYSKFSGDFDPRIHQFNGVKFDVRGAILLDGYDRDRLAGRKNADLRQAQEFPNRLSGIAIRRKAESLHFLHGMYGMALSARPSRDVIGSYWIHYSTGEKREFQIQLGRDVWPMLHRADTPLQTERSKLAWTGRIPADGPLWRFYHSEWKNPLPDVEISHIDFTAKTTPVLFALTCK